MDHSTQGRTKDTTAYSDVAEVDDRDPPTEQMTTESVDVPGEEEKDKEVVQEAEQLQETEKVTDVESPAEQTLTGNQKDLPAEEEKDEEVVQEADQLQETEKVTDVESPVKQTRTDNQTDLPAEEEKKDEEVVQEADQLQETEKVIDVESPVEQTPTKKQKVSTEGNGTTVDETEIKKSTSKDNSDGSDVVAENKASCGTAIKLVFGMLLLAIGIGAVLNFLAMDGIFLRKLCHDSFFHSAHSHCSLLLLHLSYALIYHHDRNL